MNTAKILPSLRKARRAKGIFLLLSEGKGDSLSRNMNRLPGLRKPKGLLLLSRHLSFKGSYVTESEMWLNEFREENYYVAKLTRSGYSAYNVLLYFIHLVRNPKK